MTRGIFGSLALLLFAACAQAADDFSSQAAHNWHQWRGPLATGVAPDADPPLEWSETKNIKWKVKLPGESTATPIVWGDKIFIVTAVQTDRTIELPEDEAKPMGPFQITKPANYYQFIVMCLDRRTGKTLWEHTAREEVPHEGRHADGSFASASPTTDGQHLYVSFGSRGVHCYDLNGQPKWQRDLGKMKIIFTFGEGSSPVLYGDTVIINWDHQGGLKDKKDGSFITALDAQSGETRWKIDRDETTTWATPLLVSYGGKQQLVVHGSKRVRSYDPANGQEIWACGGQTPSAIPTCVADDRNVYCMSGYMGNAVYAIPLDTVGDITEFAKKKEPEKIAWMRGDPGAPYIPSPLLYDGQLYFMSSNKGIVTCLEAKTGKPLIERKRIEGIANIYASPVGAAGRVYFTSREGATVVVKLGPELEILATNQLDDRFDGSMAVVGKEILLRGRENLYCISSE
ncbi:MAG: PQQ-binding-like beta-propeller repeat protein [Pirellulales bacterium]